MKFWDSSALVPLLVKEATTPLILQAGAVLEQLAFMCTTLLLWSAGAVLPLSMGEAGLRPKAVLGRLGGHLDHRSDGLPGWQTLWRGMLTLQTLVESVHLSRQLGQFG